MMRAGWAFFGDLAHLAKPDAFARLLAEVRRLEWVVYAKPPFGGPQQVLAYLGRYTHRVAIANPAWLAWSMIASRSAGEIIVMAAGRRS